MEEHIVKILKIEAVTSDVKCYRIEKPAGYSFIPGQATDVCINKPEWQSEMRPFTFTALNSWDYLEFTIKSYHDHDGVTNQLDKLTAGDELIIHDVWGSIHYESPGLFIAGGAGITPFIAIFRELASKNQLSRNRLIFANKTVKDIIRNDEFHKMLGENFINILSNEKSDGYHYGFITEEFLKPYLKTNDESIYLCGPPPMMEAVQNILEKLGIGGNRLIFEM